MEEGGGEESGARRRRGRMDGAGSGGMHRWRVWGFPGSVLACSWVISMEGGWAEPMAGRNGEKTEILFAETAETAVFTSRICSDSAETLQAHLSTPVHTRSALESFKTVPGGPQIIPQSRIGFLSSRNGCRFQASLCSLPPLLRQRAFASPTLAASPSAATHSSRRRVQRAKPQRLNRSASRAFARAAIAHFRAQPTHKRRPCPPHGPKH